ncbi:MAG: hypothetical protein FWC50_12955 [Planctomycetaceae bacterium]|nr:hypothetical protein [Planctomycetaceae bacterium]
MILCIFLNAPGCNFPYKIDPSGSCLFVKNEQASLPENRSPFIASTGPTTTTANPSATTTPVVTPTTVSPPTLPGVNAVAGTASGTTVSGTATSGTIIRGADPNSGTPLTIPGSGPIVIATPAEQIALVGSEVLVFANYKGDDDYLRTGERIEWSLGGVGHIQTTNKTECGNWLSLDFNKDKKVSDRFAVTSTLHNEGVINRVNGDEQSQIPHLAGQSWVSIQSAEEGTSTVTAFAPTITDWGRRSSSVVVHWIDAEWIYPTSDVTQIEDQETGTRNPKIFVTTIKKRSSGAPCPGWIVNYEITGGPDAGFGPQLVQSIPVTTNANGEASIDMYQKAGIEGTNTVLVKIIRPAGVDGGTRRLELDSKTVANSWTKDSPLTMSVNIASETVRWEQQVPCTIDITNRSSVNKSGIVTLPLPPNVKFVSALPQPNSNVTQADGSQLLTWQLAEIRGKNISRINLVVMPTSSDPAVRSQPINMTLNANLTQMLGNPTGSGDTTSGGSTSSSSSATMTSSGGSGTGSGGYPVNPAGNPGTGSIFTTPPPSVPGGSTSNGSTFGNSTSQSGAGGAYGGMQVTPPSQGSSDPATFSGKIKVEAKFPGTAKVNQEMPALLEITNDLSSRTPFFGGKMRITCSDGILLKLGDGQHVQTAMVDITTNTGEAIPPGTALPFHLFFVPTKPGSLFVTFDVLGFRPGSQTPEVIVTTRGMVRAIQ